MEQLAYGFLHCHSEHSLMDSPLKVKDMCEHAKNMGATAIALTDHGTCTGIFEFMETCKSLGMKAIPGVEAYVNSKYTKRAHLVLLAKNYKGYQEISRAVTESNEHLENVGGIMMPMMDKEILARNFGNGNVIATSACISGVLASVMRYNDETLKQVGKLEKKLGKYGGFDESKYEERKLKLTSLEENIKSLNSEKNVLEGLASKKYKKRQTGLKSMRVNAKTEEDFLTCEEQEKMLEAEMEESKKAAEKLAKIKKELTALRSKKTKLESKLKDDEKIYSKREDIFTDIEDLKQLLMDEKEIWDLTEKELLWYKDLFGDDFYVEIQNHGMQEEKEVMPALAKLAIAHNVPVIASNDSHITTKEKSTARQFMQSLRFDTWMELSATEEECYMKSDMELYESICKIVDVDIANQAMRNIRNVCDMCSVEIPKEDHYPKFRDANGREVSDKEAADILRNMAYAAIPKRYPKGFHDYTRLEYELKTIIDLGYAHYTLIVADFIGYARNYGLNNDETGVAYSVGPGRGSGIGSVVNYLTGITNIDPLKYGLIFERYLNSERASMPDIDTDMSGEVREAAIDYVRRRYGDAAVAYIHTRNTQGAKDAIENAARIRGYELYPTKSADDSDAEEAEEKKLKHKEVVKEGRKRLYQIGEQLRKDIPNKVGIKLKDCIDDLKKKHKSAEAQIILERAQALEGTVKSISVHAAGIIITDGAPIRDYVPVLYNHRKNLWAVQCDKEEAERVLHLLKMDFLGLTNLDIITECVRRIKRNTGISINPDNLPFDKEVFKEVYASGQTNCVFQFESGGMKQMLREFKPDSLEDIILLVAAYRPGPMQYLENIIDVKHGRKPLSYLTPELEPILSLTYGSIIYQEQVQLIFQKLAGYSLGQADIVRRAMSKKKEDVLLAERKAFVYGDKERNITGCVAGGISEVVANKLFDEMTDFAKYAFNRSHATGYAVVSYQTAWLKHHYPAEYMCAVMNNSDTKKIPTLLYECKRLGLDVTLPDINKSWEYFEDRQDYIIYGLKKIKGVASAASQIISEREENGPFLSYTDFLLRSHANSGITEKLIKSGVFDCFHKEKRSALEYMLPQCMGFLDTIKKKNKAIAECEQLLAEETDKKEQEKLNRKKENALAAKENAEIQLKEMRLPPSIIDDQSESLLEEKELLGAYISSHPLERYTAVYRDSKIVLSDNFREGNIWCAGLISNLKIVKKNGEMAFFEMEDTTGIINVCCFKDAYEKFKGLVKENKVVKIYGKGIIESAYNDDEEPVHKLIVYKMYPCTAKKKPVMVSVPAFAEWESKIKEKVMLFEEEYAHPVILHDASTGDMKDAGFCVKSDTLELEIPGVYMKLLDFH